MDMKKFTEKSISALQSAQALATQYGNSQIEQAHLLSALLDSEEGLIYTLLKKMGKDVSNLQTQLKTHLSRLPKVSGGERYVSPDLAAAISEAETQMTRMGDEYLSVEHLFYGLTEKPDGTLQKLFNQHEITQNDFLSVLSTVRGIKVDVRNPEIVLRVEIREKEAFIHAGQERGAGGIPYGSSGRGLLLLSGGIDSPVAGYMMAKRGVQLEAIHFESFPYTSERAKEKVLDLAKILTDYALRIRVHVVSLTKIQELIRDNCDEDYFTLLLRRYMMAISVKIAHQNDCEAIITGESLGQVASQTMKAINVTNVLSDLPIYRPLIGMDKEEIITISRKIGAFETSVLPFEDCCTVFTPRHPRTRPELEAVLAEESKLDFDALVDEAINTKQVVVVKQFGDNKIEE